MKRCLKCGKQAQFVVLASLGSKEAGYWKCERCGFRVSDDRLFYGLRYGEPGQKAQRVPDGCLAVFSWKECWW